MNTDWERGIADLRFEISKGNGENEVKKFGSLSPFVLFVPFCKDFPRHLGWFGLMRVNRKTDTQNDHEIQTANFGGDISFSRLLAGLFPGRTSIGGDASSTSVF
jgi:hypothetical protein